MLEVCTPLLMSLILSVSGLSFAQTPPPAIRPGDPVTLNFVDAEIEAVAP